MSASATPDNVSESLTTLRGAGGSEAADALALAGDLLVEVLVLDEVEDGYAELAAGARGPVDVEELGDDVGAGEDDRLAGVDRADERCEGVDRWLRGDGAPGLTRRADGGS